MKAPLIGSRKQFAIWFGIPVLLLFLFGGPIEQLLLGWLYFPLRVVPKMTPDWIAVLLGISSFVIFVALLHTTIHWFAQGNFIPRSANQTWSRRSTLAVSLAVIILFSAGTAMVGATHQFVWIFTGKPGQPADDEAQKQRMIPSLLSLITHAKESSNKSAEQSRLRWLGSSFRDFESSRIGLPPGGTMDRDGTLLHGWAIFLSGHTMYYAGDQINYTIPWNEPPNDRIYKCALGDYVNPCLSGPYFDDAGFGLSHVAANAHLFPVETVDTTTSSNPHSRSDLAGQRRASDRPKKKVEIKPISANTLLVGTVNDQFKPWGHPANVRDPSSGINKIPTGFGGPPSWRGAMFVKRDGSVEMISEQIDPQVMKAISGIARRDD